MRGQLIFVGRDDPAQSNAPEANAISKRERYFETFRMILLWIDDSVFPVFRTMMGRGVVIPPHGELGG